MLGCLPSAWNTTITLHQSFGNIFCKCNVSTYIQNSFRNNYVKMFFPMVVCSKHLCKLTLRIKCPMDIWEDSQSDPLSMVKKIGMSGRGPRPSS